LCDQIRDVRKTQVRERDREKEGLNEDPEPQTSRLFTNRKSSAAPHSEEIQRLSNQAREEVKKKKDNCSFVMQSRGRFEAFERTIESKRNVFGIPGFGGSRSSQQR
jgi:hypothetical protein